MAAALIMEPPHQQEEGEDSAHARRAQNILKQKVVSDQLKEQVENDFSEQVFLPEDSSWSLRRSLTIFPHSILQTNFQRLGSGFVHSLAG